jgi:hypothetical protein
MSRASVRLLIGNDSADHFAIRIAFSRFEVPPVIQRFRFEEWGLN